jgi:hypothetical protein
MTELTPNPVPGAPAPVPAPTEPAKKGGAGKTVGTIVGVLVVLAVLAFKFGWPYLQEAIAASKFVVGTCLDVDLDGPDGTIDEINAVDCASAEAKSKIVAIFDGTVEDTDRLCPDTAIAGVQRDDKLFCVVYND